MVNHWSFYFASYPNQGCMHLIFTIATVLLFFNSENLCTIF